MSYDVQTKTKKGVKMSSELIIDIDKYIAENPPVVKQRTKTTSIKDTYEKYRESILKMLKYNRDEKGVSVGANFTNKDIQKMLETKAKMVFAIEEKKVMRDGKDVIVTREKEFKRLVKYVSDLKKEVFKA